MRTTALALLLPVLFTGNALAHCEIPCGIYGDKTRFDLLREDMATVRKAMWKITALGKAKPPNHNQIVRWVLNKEKHADRIRKIVVDYFLAQRIKAPSSADKAARARYLKTLVTCHQLIQSTMKAKQTTSAKVVSQLHSGLNELYRLYMTPQGMAHIKKHHARRNKAGVVWTHPKVSMKQFCRQTPGVWVGDWQLTDETPTHWNGVLHYPTDNVTLRTLYGVGVTIPKSSKPPVDLTRYKGGLVVLKGPKGSRVLGYGAVSGLSFFTSHPDHAYQKKKGEKKTKKKRVEKRPQKK